MITIKITHGLKLGVALLTVSFPIPCYSTSSIRLCGQLSLSKSDPCWSIPRVLPITPRAAVFYREGIPYRRPKRGSEYTDWKHIWHCPSWIVETAIHSSVLSSTFYPRRTYLVRAARNVISGSGVSLWSFTTCLPNKRVWDGAVIAWQTVPAVWSLGDKIRCCLKTDRGYQNNCICHWLMTYEWMLVPLLIPRFFLEYL